MEVSHRWWVWNPKVDLKLLLTDSAKFVTPSSDFIGIHHQSPARSESAGVGYGNRK
jgi:hypothetical protein